MWVKRVGQLVRDHFEKKGRGSEKETNQARASKKDFLGIVGPVLGLMALVLIGRSVFPPRAVDEYVTVRIADELVYLEYAAQRRAWRQGLRYRPFLHERGGVFFDLRDPRVISVSMEHVNFPLRVATLADDLTVMESVLLEPDQVDHTFEAPARFFIEVHPRFALRPGIRLDEVNPEGHIRERRILRSASL